MFDDEVRRISIDDPAAFGHDFERGRMNAQSEGPDPGLVDDVRTLLLQMRGLDALQPKRDGLANEIAELKNRSNSSPGERVLVSAGLMAFLAALFLMLPINEVVDSTLGSFLLALMPAAGIAWLSYRPVRKYAEKEEREERQKLDGKERELARCEAEIRQCRDAMERCHIDRIPERYRNEAALAFFADAFADGRALSIMHAANLYEEELHRRRMREMQQEQLNLQKEQLDEQKRANEHAEGIAGAAIATGALVVAGAFVRGILKK